MAINVSKKLILANETSYFARNTSSAMASAEIIASQSLTKSPRPAKTPGPGFFTTFSTKTVPFRYAFRRKTAKNSLAAAVLPMNGGILSGS